MATANKYNLHIENSAFFKRVVSDHPRNTHIVDALEIHKPWLIAERNGLPKEAWEIIFRANKITNPLDLKEGRLLVIPKPEEIEDAENRIR